MVPYKIGPKKLGSFAAYISFVCLNFLWHTPHAAALDTVLSLSPKPKIVFLISEPVLYNYYCIMVALEAPGTNIAHHSENGVLLLLLFISH